MLATGEIGYATEQTNPGRCQCPHVRLSTPEISPVLRGDCLWNTAINALALTDPFAEIPELVLASIVVSEKPALSVSKI